MGDLVWGHLVAVGELRPGSHHIGLKQAAFEEDVVFVERLHDGGQHSFSDLLANFDRVVSVGKDLGLDDGNEAVVLADCGVARQAPSILLDGLLAGEPVANLEHGTPLSEAAAKGVVLSSHGGKAVEPHGGGLVIGAGDDLDALVDLDSGNDALFEEHVDELLAVLGGVLALSL